MKRLMIVLLLSSPVMAQDIVRQHERTSTFLPRFEIFQSTIAARVTLKLDKFTGKVWEIVRDTSQGDAFVWQFIPHSGVKKAVATNKVSFQLFTSGSAVRHTYLLNLISDN